MNSGFFRGGFDSIVFYGYIQINSTINIKAENKKLSTFYPFYGKKHGQTLDDLKIARLH